jgi:hypothetical protein
MNIHLDSSGIIIFVWLLEGRYMGEWEKHTHIDIGKVLVEPEIVN